MDTRLPDKFDSAWPIRKAAYRSWASMKTWVMAWLWYLNALYWVGFAYLERPEALWTIVSYLTVGPIIALMIVSQRGLTRASGLIHLPWVPYTVYLGLRLFTDRLGPALSFADGGLYAGWLHAVFFSTALCLAFDALDVARWLAGERYVLGTPAAHAAGASKLARQDG